MKTKQTLDISPCLCVFQENGLSHVPGLTAVRSSPVLTSWRATIAPTRGRRSSAARFVTSASCAATTWWSTPGATQISSPACWRGPTAAAAAALPHVPAPSATTAARTPPAPPSAPPSAQPTRLKLKTLSHFLPLTWEACVFVITLVLHSCQNPPALSPPPRCYSCACCGVPYCT